MREHRCKRVVFFLLHSVRPWWLPQTWQAENRAEWNFLFPVFFFCPPLSLFFGVNFSFGSCARTAMPDFNRCKFDMRAHPAASPWNLCFCDPSTLLPLLTCQKHLPSVRSNPCMSSKNILRLFYSLECFSFPVFRDGAKYSALKCLCARSWDVKPLWFGKLIRWLLDLKNAADCRPVQIDRAGGKRNSKIFNGELKKKEKSIWFLWVCTPHAPSCDSASVYQRSRVLDSSWFFFFIIFFFFKCKVCLFNNCCLTVVGES